MIELSDLVKYRKILTCLHIGLAIACIALRVNFFKYLTISIVTELTFALIVGIIVTRNNIKYNIKINVIQSFNKLFERI